MSLRKNSMTARRDRILAAAREIIARDGFDALTTRGLAEAAGVTAPTLYNLIGSKEEIVRALVRAGTRRLQGMLGSGHDLGTIARIEAIADATLAMTAANQSYFRALTICNDRIAGGFSPHPSAAVSASAADVAIAIIEPVLSAAAGRGELAPVRAIPEIAEQMFYCYRGPYRDWAYGAITLDEADRRTRRGHFIVLAAVAHEPLRAQAMARLASLAPPEAV